MERTQIIALVLGVVGLLLLVAAALAYFLAVTWLPRWAVFTAAGLGLLLAIAGIVVYFMSRNKTQVERA